MKSINETEIDLEFEIVSYDVPKHLNDMLSRFTILASTSKKLSEAEKYLRMAERCAKLLEVVNPDKKFDLIGSFLERLNEPMVRSKSYQLYLDFCERNLMTPASRNEFYSYLTYAGFKTTRSSNNYMISPPDNMKELRKLIE